MSDRPAREKYFFEPLSERHRRETFFSGNQELDRYFCGDAIRQDVSRRTTAAFVMTPDGTLVAGFHTLSSLAVAGAELPEKLAKKLPSRRPVGVTLLGRMAIRRDLQGRGFGSDLLMDALYRSLLASRSVASWAVVVDAKPGALDFYLKYEFIPFPGNPNRLFLPMAAIEKLFGKK